MINSDIECGGARIVVNPYGGSDVGELAYALIATLRAHNVPVEKFVETLLKVDKS